MTSQNEIHNAIGQLARQLHDALNGLGMADDVKGLAIKIPDARERLSYIAQLTGNAAGKVLDIVDSEKERQVKVKHLLSQLKAHILIGEEEQAFDVIRELQNQAEITNLKMTEVMEAQDFHDLTTQVVTNVISLTTKIESQLIKLVVDTAPIKEEEKKELTVENYVPVGPSIDKKSTDVAQSQSDVDDLLASLGF